ncbi:MAG: SURF1 family protein [Hyphomicrobiaceae bacterium]|nr:SURF1 family protein [Hyphomicrobiaceae bacterium]
MGSEPRRSGLVWLTILSLAALIVLVGLGTWQLQRRAWKEDLIARIKARAVEAPVTLADPRVAAVARRGQPVGQGLAAEALAIWQAAQTPEFLRVRVQGAFAPRRDLFYYAPDPRRGPGWQVVSPFRLADGRVVLVNRGYVSEAERRGPPAAWAAPGGTLEITGRLRSPGHRAMFEPVNNVAANQWYWRDLPAMAREVLDGQAAATTVVPFFLELEASPQASARIPQPLPARVDLPNNHLQYALTWFGLALTLLGVWGAYLWQAVRRR